MYYTKWLQRYNPRTGEPYAKWLEDIKQYIGCAQHLPFETLMRSLYSLHAEDLQLVLEQNNPIFNKHIKSSKFLMAKANDSRSLEYWWKTATRPIKEGNPRTGETYEEWLERIKAYSRFLQDLDMLDRNTILEKFPGDDLTLFLEQGSPILAKDIRANKVLFERVVYYRQKRFELMVPVFQDLVQTQI